MDLLKKKEKLIIERYKNRERNSSAGKKLEVRINPESMTRRHEHKYSGHRGLNSSKNTAMYVYSLAEELSFKLIMIDSKIVDYGAEALTAIPATVTDQVKEFMEVCYTMNGGIHEPNFLNITWGDNSFKCKLKSMDLQYTSFNSDGKPRRAELSVTFIEDISRKAAAKLEDKNSPDLTHMITVKEGDTLPLLTESVYGAASGSLYLEIARVNNLNDFRRLQPGQQLFFPPLDK